MKKQFLLIVPLIFFLSKAFSQDFQLIRDTGEKLNDFPIMEVVNDTAAVYKNVHKAVSATFMGDAVQLYHLAQNYLINTGQLDHPEPAYLAITKNEGGFAKKGFYLRQGTQLMDKTHASYIDLTESNITGKLDKVSSITQIFPHELGHAIYRMLSQHDTIEHQSNASSMHYFSLITDYAVAFNEGFAEHIENVARHFERNDSIKAGIDKSIVEMKPFVLRSAQAFKRDFQWPLRLDYYKETMVVWYQKYEDYMRAEHAVRDEATYKNIAPDLGNPEDMITIRNCGIQQSDIKRNKSQLMASEGFVSTFFTHLFSTGLPDHYETPAFYRPFLKDTLTAVTNPSEMFSPLQNMFSKYFYVMNRHVNSETSDSAQLIDFILGYTKEFPDDAEFMLSTYENLTGEKFDSLLAPQIWFLVKNYHHRVLALDALDAITVPVYTFDLNQAEVEDLLTLKGIPRNEAESVIKYRDQKGFLENYDEISSIPGIQQETVKLLNESKFDKEYYNSIDEGDLNIQALLVKPVIHLLSRMGIYFLIICAFMYAGFLRSVPIRKLSITFLKYLFFFLLFGLVGLVSVVIQGKTLIIFLPFLAMFLLIGLIILRKRKEALYRFFAVAGLMGVLVLYSLI